MNIVLDLGANVECGEKNLIDFLKWGLRFTIQYFQTRKQSSTA